MFPAVLLKQTSVEVLEKAIHKEFEHVDKSIPWALRDPTPLLEDIVWAARRTLERARRPLSDVRNVEQGRPLLEPRGQKRIAGAVRSVISCELADGYFQWAKDLDELFEAIHAQFVIIADSIEGQWKTHGPTYISGAAFCFTPLPRHVLSNIFSRLDIGDFVRAASTCEHWLSVALDPAHSALRAHARWFRTDECDILGAVEVFTHKMTMLYASILPDGALDEPHIRLFRPSTGTFQRAVESLPSVEPLVLLVHNATPGRMHFTVGTGTGTYPYREFVDVEWDLWLYLERWPDATRETLGPRLCHIDVPAGLDLSLLESVFPLAELCEMTVQNGPTTLDRAAMPTEPDAGMFPWRLLWPRSSDGSESEPGIFESDVFTAW